MQSHATHAVMQFLVEDPDMPLSEKLSMGAKSMMGSVRSFGSNVKDVAGCCTAAARRGATYAKRVTRDAGVCGVPCSKIILQT
jgi:hypothetical protein